MEVVDTPDSNLKETQTYTMCTRLKPKHFITLYVAMYLFTYDQLVMMILKFQTITQDKDVSFVPLSCDSSLFIVSFFLCC